MSMPIDNDDDKLLKARSRSSISIPVPLALSQLMHKYNTNKSTLNMNVRDTKRGALTLSIMFILFFWLVTSLFSGGGLFSLGGIFGQRKTIYQIVEENKNNLNFFNDQTLHSYLNEKISKEAIGFGFGKANTHKIMNRPLQGSSPLIENPGIFKNYLNKNDEEEYSNESIGNYEVSSSSFSFFGSKKKEPKRKIYIILGKSHETGITNRKSKEQWLIEKFSILNKIHYSKKFQYELIMINNNDHQWQTYGLNQKKYDHEFRQGWEKFDIMRKVMKETSNKEVDNKNTKKKKKNDDVEEWFWYVDLMTLIMEPDLPLEEIIFKKLDYMYRDLTYFNPNNLAVDDSTKLLNNEIEGDKNDFNSIDLILTQDCEGINLNSFLMKKSEWSNLLLDVIWDPIMYKQMHVKWSKRNVQDNNKYSRDKAQLRFTANTNDVEEKNCLEYLFNTQSWIRSKIGFMPIRAFNSLSKDYCKSEIEELDDEDFELEMKLTNQKDSIINANAKAQAKDSNSAVNDDANTRTNNAYLQDESNFYYNETDNDFLVNFANCEQLHNCWDRFNEYSIIYNEVHKSWFNKLFW